MPSALELKKALNSFCQLTGLISGTAGRNSAVDRFHSSSSLSPQSGEDISQTHKELVEIIDAYFGKDNDDDARQRTALVGWYCKGLLATLGSLVEELAEAAQRAIALDLSEEAEALSDYQSMFVGREEHIGTQKKCMNMDIHVSFMPHHPQWIAKVTVRDVRTLRSLAGLLYVNAFLNEGRVGGELIDFAKHTRQYGRVSCGRQQKPSGASSSALHVVEETDGGNNGERLIVTALHHLLRAEKAAKEEIESLRLQRLQTISAATKSAGGSGAASADRHSLFVATAVNNCRRAVGLDFLGDDGSLMATNFASASPASENEKSADSSMTSSVGASALSASPLSRQASAKQQQQHLAALAAMRRATTTLISKSIFRCSLENLPLWSDVKRAVEESLIGGVGEAGLECDDGDQQEEDAMRRKAATSVRDGAVAALRKIWERRESEATLSGTLGRRGCGGDQPKTRANATLSCSFDLTPSLESDEQTAASTATDGVAGTKRARLAPSTTSSYLALPEFPPAASSSAVDSGVLAVYMCDKTTGAIVRVPNAGSLPITNNKNNTQNSNNKSSKTSKKSNTAEHYNDQNGKSDQPNCVADDTAAAAPSSPSSAPPNAHQLKVVHFLIQDDGRNRVDFVNAML